MLVFFKTQCVTQCVYVYTHIHTYTYNYPRHLTIDPPRLVKHSPSLLINLTSQTNVQHSFKCGFKWFSGNQLSFLLVMHLTQTPNVLETWLYICQSDIFIITLQKKSLNVKTKAFIISAFRRHTYLYGVLQYHLSKQPSAKTENHTGKLSAAHHWIFQYISSKTSG